MLDNKDFKGSYDDDDEDDEEEEDTEETQNSETKENNLVSGETLNRLKNLSNIDTAQPVYARTVHVVSFPIFTMKVYEIDDNVSVIDLNGMIVVAHANPENARKQAVNMLISGFESLFEGLDNFMEKDYESFLKGESNETPKVPKSDQP